MRRMRWSARMSRVLKALGSPWRRFVLCSRVTAHTYRGSCEGEKYKEQVAQWTEMLGKSAQSYTALPCAGNSGTVAGAG